MLTRRQFLSSSGLVVAATAVSRPTLFAQAAQAQATTRFQELRGGVGVFISSGGGPAGTIGWIATPDGSIAIDSQNPTSARACVDGLLQRSKQGIQMLINTHHHGDHTSGNPVFRPVVRSIVQHERCDMLHRQTTRAAGTEAQQAYADETFDDAWSTEIGNETITAT